MENPNQPNLDKQPENQPSGAQEALQQAEQTLRDATQSPPYTGSSDISQDDKNVAMLAHLLAPFFGFIPPLIFWLMNKDKAGKDFVCDQAKEALNFQITVILAVFVSCLLMIVLIGILLFWLVLAANFVLCIIAAIAASKGTVYRYPFALRLVK